MSGMGPASCWVTHKRLESWARAAKERALGTTSPKHKDNGSNSNSSNNSLDAVSHVVYGVVSVVKACVRAIFLGRYPNFMDGPVAARWVAQVKHLFTCNILIQCSLFSNNNWGFYRNICLT